MAAAREVIVDAARTGAAFGILIGIELALGVLIVGAAVGELVEWVRAQRQYDHVVSCPDFGTVDEAIDWFAERGATRPVPWRGPDGRVRGSAVLRGAT